MKTPFTSSRRRFLKTAGAAMAGPYLLTNAALGQGNRPPASDRIVMATIGCGGQGRGDMNGFMGHPEVQMVAVCDPVTAHREQARAAVNRRYNNNDCRAYNDFREVLARPDIDAVLIATPDHWHAIITIEACKQGKDVYCEKPESLTVREGRAMVEAVRRYGRVFSGGSQRVLGDYGNGDVPRMIWSGGIGAPREAFVSCGGPPSDCNLPELPVPAGVDWEMWLGPAPWRGFHPQLINFNFRPYREYSGWQMTDWGAHRFGAALFATQHHLTGPTHIHVPGPAHRLLTFEFADGFKMYHGGSGNITYVGTEGQWPGNFRRPERLVDMPHYKGRGGIFGDFLHCVKTRERCFRDVEIAHRACTVCHLGNIAYALNRSLRWDPDREEIIGDEEASRRLDRPKREPWTL